MPYGCWSWVSACLLSMQLLLPQPANLCIQSSASQPTPSVREEGAVVLGQTCSFWRHQMLET